MLNNIKYLMTENNDDDISDRTDEKHNNDDNYHDADDVDLIILSKMFDFIPFLRGLSRDRIILKSGLSKN